MPLYGSPLRPHCWIAPTNPRPRCVCFDDAVPEPPHPLDPVVLSAARHRRRVRWSWTALAAAAVGGLAVASSIISVHPGDHRHALGVADGPLAVSSLAHRTALGATANSALPGIHLAHPGQGSLIATVGPEKVYLVETTDGSLCTVVDDGPGSAVFRRGCGPRSGLLTTGVISSTVPNSPPHNDERTSVVIVLPDGYRSATLDNKTVLVSNNAALLMRPFSARSVTITGPSKPAITFNLNRYLVSTQP
jgi:hypothetical protein